MDALLVVRLTNAMTTKAVKANDGTEEPVNAYHRGHTYYNLYFLLIACCY